MELRRLPVAACSLLLLLPGPFASAQQDAPTPTRDVFASDFPPAKYWQSLEEIEATAQDVIERVFRDDDGILRGGVNGWTMRPLDLRARRLNHRFREASD